MKHSYLLLVLLSFSVILPETLVAGVFDEAVSGGDDSSVDVGTSATAENGDGADENTDAGTSDSSGAMDMPPSSAGTGSGLNFDFNGYIRGDVFVGKMPEYSRGELKNGYGELSLKLQVSKSRYGSAFGEVRFKGGYLKDSHYLGEPSDTAPTGEDRLQMGGSVQLREAYVDWYLGRLEFRLGQQIVLWGRADGINPTNNITPVDMRVRSPEEDDRRMANIGLRVKLDLSPVRFEGIWMPVYSPSVMPQVKLASALIFDEPDYPDFDLANGLVAGKIHLVFPAIEMSVSYLNGYSLTPGIVYAGNNFSDAYYEAPDPEFAMFVETPDTKTVTLMRKAYRHQVVGFDFSTTLGSFMGLRGELAFRFPEAQNEAAEDRYYIPNPDLYYVLGADKEFGNLMVVAQYVGRYTFDWKEHPIYNEDHEDFFNSLVNEPDLNNLDEAASWEMRETLVNYMATTELVKTNRMIHGQSAEIQHGVSLRLSWSVLHEALKFIAFGMANFTTQEFLIYPKVQYMVTDDMTVTAGAEIYIGPDDTLFGMIDETLTAGYAELKVSF